jgi:anti-sigma factor RsiW
MQLKHLTDDEIQDYLDGNLPEEKTLSIKRHLDSCPACRQALRQYQTLYEDLQEDKGFELSKGFARAVLQQIPTEPEAQSRFSFLNTLLVVLGILIPLGVTLYYLDLGTLGRTLSHILLEPLGGFEDLLVSLNGSLGLAACAILTLIVIFGLDRLIARPKYKHLLF